jgi:hypothetical protein
VSKFHRRRMRNVEEVQFASLFHRFEDEYGDASVQLAEQLRESYPEITRRGRRTGRALGNISFFVWCCGRNGDRNLIPTLFRAAVLLSAQDDYYDNPRIPAAEKESFCMATNNALRTDSVPPAFEQSVQLRELSSLWSDVAGTIPASAPQVRRYWIEKACQLNDAMAAENRAVRSGTLTYDAYMSTAVHSIGMVYFWATYLAHKHVPVTRLREMDPVLLLGAKIVRLSNDLASYRQQKNKENAVTLAGGTGPRVRILRLVSLESRAFCHCVEALDVGADVRGVLVRSMEFLREFYQRSDFDRKPDW